MFVKVVFKLPVPLAPRLIEVLSFFQLYVVPVTLLLKGTLSSSPLQTGDGLATVFIVGVVPVVTVTVAVFKQPALFVTVTT